MVIRPEPESPMCTNEAFDPADAFRGWIALERSDPLLRPMLVPVYASTWSFGCGPLFLGPWLCLPLGNTRVGAAG